MNRAVPNGQSNAQFHGLRQSNHFSNQNSANITVTQSPSQPSQHKPKPLVPANSTPTNNTESSSLDTNKSSENEVLPDTRKIVYLPDAVPLSDPLDFHIDPDSILTFDELELLNIISPPPLRIDTNVRSSSKTKSADTHTKPASNKQRGKLLQNLILEHYQVPADDGFEMQDSRTLPRQASAPAYVKFSKERNSV